MCVYMWVCVESGQKGEAERLDAYVYVWVCVSVCMCVCRGRSSIYDSSSMVLRIYVYIRVYIYIYIYVCVYICVYVCVQKRDA